MNLLDCSCGAFFIPGVLCTEETVAAWVAEHLACVGGPPRSAPDPPPVGPYEEIPEDGGPRRLHATGVPAGSTVLFRVPR